MALMKMWFSFGAMGMMFIAILFILMSRHKISNPFLKGITAFIAYSFMIVSGLIIFVVVFSGPVSK
ncbi:DUF2768 domain-containing protein [Ectobacillus antri]|jgi:hypothetical protein|uniref:DUF2768 domain-containing protein n=1 Tax=Ectobacillus antri TaxID=2486280 RepID=A0ABT6H1Z5_9BACI|nr:DUF2768 domain-containing protein [Ectobacillus antri]MDG4656089.1 DUF2768 domain-containing protein [Ectobacillus antri]MDG5752764.1 DUF2768 domain-containing protein [Ectobacillus antri]